MHRNELKWIKDLKLRSEITKLPEENIGSTLSDVGLSNNFLDMSPKANVNKWVLHQTKWKQSIGQKRPPIERGKIFANVSD